MPNVIRLDRLDLAAALANDVGTWAAERERRSNMLAWKQQMDREAAVQAQQEARARDLDLKEKSITARSDDLNARLAAQGQLQTERLDAQGQMQGERLAAQGQLQTERLGAASNRQQVDLAARAARDQAKANLMDKAFVQRVALWDLANDAAVERARDAESARDRRYYDGLAAGREEFNAKQVMAWQSFMARMHQQAAAAARLAGNAEYRRQDDALDADARRIIVKIRTLETEYNNAASAAEMQQIRDRITQAYGELNDVQTKREQLIAQSGGAAPMQPPPGQYGPPAPLPPFQPGQGARPAPATQPMAQQYQVGQVVTAPNGKKGTIVGFNASGQPIVEVQQ